MFPKLVYLYLISLTARVGKERQKGEERDLKSFKM
jgi:hypothetical protein